MKNRVCVSLLWVPVLCILLAAQTSLAAMDQEEVSRRLDELGTIIQKQQQEIERLRKEIQNQSESIQKVQEGQKEEIQKTVSAQVQEKEKTWKEWIPQWVKNTKVYGDLRLRYEGIYNRDKELSDGSWEDVEDRNRYRIRARLLVDSKITEEFATSFMLTTDDDSVQDPTTSNQSLTADFNNKGIYLGRAYGTYMPLWLPGLEVTAGKFKNTFLHTDIMWDPDVNPEGAYERYKYAGWKVFQPFVQLGQMAVNENDLADDAALYIYQGGFEWTIGPIKWLLAGSWYDWTGLNNTKYLHNAQYKKGGGNTFIGEGTTASPFRYRYEYKLAEALSFVSFDLMGYPMMIMLDYIENTADDVPSDQDTAYYAGFIFGKEKKKGDWSLLYKYAWIERDAVVGSLNDQDFYGANRKGHKVKAVYMLRDKVGLGVAYFNTDPIHDWDPSAPDFSLDSARGHEDRLQTDVLLLF